MRPQLSNRSMEWNDPGNDHGSQATRGCQRCSLLNIWQSIAHVIRGVIETSFLQILHADPLECIPSPSWDSKGDEMVVHKYPIHNMRDEICTLKFANQVTLITASKRRPPCVGRLIVLRPYFASLTANWKRNASGISSLPILLGTPVLGFLPSWITWVWETEWKIVKHIIEPIHQTLSNLYI